jgi:hypothetical protein
MHQKRWSWYDVTVHQRHSIEVRVDHEPCQHSSKHHTKAKNHENDDEKGPSTGRLCKRLNWNWFVPELDHVLFFGLCLGHFGKKDDGFQSFFCYFHLPSILIFSFLFLTSIIFLFISQKHAHRGFQKLEFFEGKYLRTKVSRDFASSHVS